MKKIVFDLWGTLAYLKPGKDFGFAVSKELGISKQDYHNLVKKYWFRNELTAEEFAQILIDQTKETKASRDYLTSQILSPYGRQNLFPEVKTNLIRLSKTKELFLISDTSSLGKKMFYDLNISDFFNGTYFSCSEGITKEDGLFSKVYNNIGVHPSEMLVIGDSLREDYEIPKNLGSKVILLDRKRLYPKNKRIFSLEEIK